MKKLLIAVLAFVTVTVHAQTAEEVIQKYSKNMGGLDAFNKLTSAKMTGTYTTSGTDLAITVQVINGKSMRADVEAMGQAVINVYHNGKGWKINPFAGITTAEEVTGSELNDLKAQTHLANQLMDHKARGHQVELQGEETVEGIKTHKIKLTNKDDGKVTTYFISTTNHSLIKSVTVRELQGRDVEVEAWYSDVKEIGGLRFSMTRTSKIEGEIFQTVKYEKIELNVPVDEKIFERPK